MKKTYFFLFSLVFSLILKAQTPVFTEAQLKEVKVYFNGAELFQSANLKLPKGSCEVVITNIANGIDRNSIQIKSTPNVTVMSVQYSNQYLENYDHPKVSPASKSNQEELNKLENQLEKLDNLKESYVKSIELLDSNHRISDSEGFTVEELKKMVVYYQNKRYELANEINALVIEKRKINEQIDHLKFEMGLSSSNSQKTNFNKIILQVMSEKEGNFPLEINYLTQEATWRPFYDLRVEKLNTPIDLTYKAFVRQNTGIDWKQVKLGFSGGYANRYSAIPTLNPWFINYYKQPTNVHYKKDITGVLKERVNGIAVAESTISDLTQIDETQLGVTFDISVPYTVLSNGKEHNVSLKKMKLPATYKYYTVPKVNPSAFLITSVKDYGKYNLLPGRASVIFEGLYVGTTTVNPQSETNNEMQLSMGRDDKISVTRRQVSDKSGIKFFSSKKTQIFTYEITVRNNKKEPIEIEVEDQYPISQNESIEVKLINTDRAKINKEDGFLKWILNLKPNETQKIRYTYEVKYNKDEVIGNL